jgi:hypothetical protein
VEALRTTVGQAGALSAQAIAAAVFERIAGVAAP